MTREKGSGLASGAGQPLITDESAASSEELGMRNEGGGFAAIEGSGRSCSGIRYLTYDGSRRSG